MTWIQTFTGRKFSLIDPQPEDVCIEDIAHALTNICRFQGHCREFYSVAQHSVHVADMVRPECRLDGLCHDAGEAYYGDVTRPQKIVYRTMTHRETRCGPVSDWGNFAKAIDHAIAIALHLSDPMPDCVKHADNVLLATEARDLLGPPPEPWVKMPEAMSQLVRPWMPEEVHAQFMRIYEEFRRV